ARRLASPETPPENSQQDLRLVTFFVLLYSCSVKALTREQLKSRKDKAVRFVRDVLGDDDRADEIEDEDLDSYAERRKIQLINAIRNSFMANGNGDPRTKAELLDEIDQLQQENQDLQDALSTRSLISSRLPRTKVTTRTMMTTRTEERPEAAQGSGNRP